MKTLRHAFFYLLLIFLISCKPLERAVEPLTVEGAQLSFLQVVRQSPFVGERLSLEPVIEIQFDHGMERASTESAWTLLDAQGQSLAGVISWQDEATFQFKPTDKLQPDSVYTGVFAASATALDGAILADELRFNFLTVDSLAVSQVFPMDGAQEIDADAAITVIFNKPVVPVSILEERGDFPDPLLFFPAISGQGEWVNSSVYVFQPDAPLRSGTTYKAQVRSGMVDVSGSSLAKTYLWTFGTQAPQVTHYSLVRGETNPTELVRDVLLDQAFEIAFSQPMQVESVAAALEMLNRETQQALPLNLEWNEDFTLVTIQPKQNLEIASFYNLTLLPSAQAADGGSLEEGLTLKVSTVPLPGIVGVTPKPDTLQEDFFSWMKIYFASPMDFDSMKGRLQISPQPAKTSMYYSSYDWTLTVYGIEPSTEYVVRLLPGMKDIYGNSIQTEYAYSFATTSRKPYVNMLLPHTSLVYREKGKQEIFLDYLNAQEISLSVYQLSFDEYLRFANGNIPPEQFNPLEKLPVLTWTPESAAPENERRRARIDFAEQGAQLPVGYYFIGLQAKPFDYEDNFLEGSFFIVASDNLTLKTTPSEALAWLVDLETGEPVGDAAVTIYNWDFFPLGTVQTDKDGLAYFEHVSDVAYARAQADGRVAFTAREWGSGVSYGEFGAWTWYYGSSFGPFAYLYTDRPLYRPGQEVQFKGIVRESDDLHYSLPNNPDIYVKIYNSNSEDVYHQTLKLSEMGTFNSTFKIAEDALVGTYDLYAGFSPADTIATLSFRVAEYRKPDFDVTASPLAANVLVGDPLTFQLDAAYYSGGGLAQAEVNWFTEASTYTFSPSDEYADFSFTDDTRSNASQPTGGILSEGEDVTDGQGRFVVEQASSLGKDERSRTITFKMDVTDAAGNIVSGSTSAVVHQSMNYAGIRALQYVAKEGEPQTFEVVALDWDSNPLAGGAVSVELIKQQWFSVQKKNKDGTLTWETYPKETLIKREPAILLDEKGLAQVQFVPPSGGIYRVLVTVQDALGHTHQASTTLWVSSSKYVSWRQTNDRSFDLVADKTQYAPGDVAKILIASPFESEVYALVTYERGHVYEREVILLAGNSAIYELPITRDMAPGVYVSVVVIRGAQAGDLDFKMGVTQLKVDTLQQELSVSVTADKKTAGPGDQVTYTVQTKDFLGKPVSAEVSLALVDKAVLALAPSNTLPILEAFYPQRALSVFTSIGIVQNAEDFNADYEGTETDGESSGSGGGGKGMGDLGIIDVRETFKDTAYFRAVLQTDADGKASVTVTLPDNLTTWRMDARAVTEDSRVGQAASELVSTKPVFIQIHAPRFFVIGDSAQLGATVHNNTDKSLQVTVTLDTEGVEMNSERIQVVDVPARQQAYLTWDVDVAPDATRVDLLANVAGGGYEDSTRPTLGTLEDNGIPVYAFHVTETVGTSGILAEAGSISEMVLLPQTLKADAAKLSVELSPSLAASMTEGLTYLEDYPYLCIEQTISRFLPNVLSTRALKLAGQTSPLSVELNSNVASALQRIYSLQNADGGWGWWGGESQPLTSTYVLLGLVEARDAGYTVSEDVITRAIGYAQENLPPLRKNSAPTDFNRQAFSLFVLARVEHPDQGQMNLLFKYKQNLGVYAQAYLAHAMYLTDASDERIVTLLSDINGAAITSAAGTHWQEKSSDYWNWNTDGRTTAIVLNLLADVDPKNPLTANAVRWVMAGRKDGHWYSTQETAWTLMALTNWLEATGEFESDYQYAIGLNGELLQEGSATKENLADPLLVKRVLTEQANTLVITRGTGKGNLYYSAYLDATLPADQVKALDQGITLSRQYYALDDLKTPITETQQGELVQARVTIVVTESLHYVVLDDPLPAGLEAIDASLMTNAEVPSFISKQDFTLHGWGWWYFDFMGVYDEKVVLSADYLPAGTYIFTYLARASTLGTFQVIPVTAHEFYFPDVAGRGDGSVFVVKP